MRQPKLAHVPRAEIAAYLRAGASDRDLGRRYGVSSAAVWFYRKKHRLANGRPPRLASVRRDVVEWLVGRGLSDSEIGRVFKVSSAAVAGYRFKYGVK